MYDRLKAKPIEYDTCCTSVSSTLKHVSQLKTISQKIRNEGFQVDFILQYCDKPLWTLKGIEKNFNGEGNTGHNNKGYSNQNYDNLLEKRNNQDSFFSDTFNMNAKPKKKIFNQKDSINFNNNGQKNRILKKNNQPGLLDRLSTNPNEKPLNDNNGIQNELNNPNSLEYDELPEETEETCHYRVFNGSFQIELQNKSLKKMPSIELMTCTSIDNLQNFDNLTNDIVLSTAISRTDMENYINQVFKKINEYNLTIGW